MGRPPDANHPAADGDAEEASNMFLQCALINGLDDADINYGEAVAPPTLCFAT